MQGRNQNCLKFAALPPIRPNMDITSTAAQGLGNAEARFTKAAVRISNGGSGGGPVDAVDLSAEAADLLTAKDQFLASLEAMQVGQEMTRRTLDILA
jgi:hypothetical protein